MQVNAGAGQTMRSALDRTRDVTQELKCWAGRTSASLHEHVEESRAKEDTHQLSLPPLIFELLAFSMLALALALVLRVA